MRKPEKPGTQHSQTREGGALGNIDEETGHPGKGTGGDTLKPEHSGDPEAGREGKAQGSQGKDD